MSVVVRERDIRKALKARVESYGGQVRAVSWLGRKSAPDVFVLIPPDGQFDCLNAFVETKAPGGMPTDIQQTEHHLMRKAGCNVMVISTVAQLDDWLPPR